MGERGGGKDGHIDNFIHKVLNAKNFKASNLSSLIKATGQSDLHIHASRT